MFMRVALSVSRFVSRSISDLSLRHVVGTRALAPCAPSWGKGGPICVPWIKRTIFEAFENANEG